MIYLHKLIQAWPAVSVVISCGTVRYIEHSTHKKSTTDETPFRTQLSSCFSIWTFPRPRAAAAGTREKLVLPEARGEATVKEGTARSQVVEIKFSHCTVAKYRQEALALS
jgi:hypothetical protein